MPENIEDLPKDGETGIIRCICGYDVDDKNTIQCDNCGVWQHMRCMGVDITQSNFDDLIYYCDRCQSRPLNIEAAQNYIQQYVTEESQKSATKTKRGRKPGNGKRASSTTSLGRNDSRRINSFLYSSNAKQLAAEFDSTDLQSSVRDNTSTGQYTISEQAMSYIQTHANDFAPYPSDVSANSNVTVVRNVSPTSPAFPQKGLFVEATVPADYMIGPFHGLVTLQAEYEQQPTNHFDIAGGPKPGVVYSELHPICLDARKDNSDSRHLRKSCRPNCRISPLLNGTNQGRSLGWQFSIMTTKAVTAGTELTVPYQWNNAYNLLLLASDGEALDTLARNLNSEFGPCACEGGNDCLITQILTTRKPLTLAQPDSEDASASLNEHTNAKLAQHANNFASSREERKIQMAVARMENAEIAPKKRKRLNTGTNIDDKPLEGKRSMLSKVETDLRSPNSSSPPPTSIEKPANRSRTRLIRLQSPSSSEILPLKKIWLKNWLKQKLRLAREHQKMMELEVQEEAKRDAERQRVQMLRYAEEEKQRLQKEATEAAKREKERVREIWGDSAPVTPSPTVAISSPIGQHPTSTIVAASSMPDSMAGAADPLKLEPTAVKLPQTQLPKLVKKLSLSEYRKRKNSIGALRPESPKEATDMKTLKTATQDPMSVRADETHVQTREARPNHESTTYEQTSGRSMDSGRSNPVTDLMPSTPTPKIQPTMSAAYDSSQFHSRDTWTKNPTPSAPVYHADQHSSRSVQVNTPSNTHSNPFVGLNVKSSSQSKPIPTGPRASLDSHTKSNIPTGPKSSTGEPPIGHVVRSWQPTDGLVPPTRSMNSTDLPSRPKLAFWDNHSTAGTVASRDGQEHCPVVPGPGREGFHDRNAATSRQPYPDPYRPLPRK